MAVLGILVLSGVVLLLVLLPTASTDDEVKKNAKSTTSKGTFNDLDKLSMANIEVSYDILITWKYPPPPFRITDKLHFDPYRRGVQGCGHF